MAFNKVILLGNLTRDPETRTTPSGNSVTNFSLAVNRVFNNKNGERQEEVAFIECEAWGKTGETIAKYVQKGRQLMVEGRLRQDSWEDKDTGKKRSQLRVVVEGFSFVGSAGDNAGNSGSSSNSSARNQKPVDESDSAIEDADAPIDLSDIPF